jgi:hypothetical protein
MRKFSVDKAYQVAELIGKTHLMLSRMSEAERKVSMPSEQRKLIIDQLSSGFGARSASALKYLGFSNILIMEFLEQFKNQENNITYDDMGLFLEKLSERLRHELSLYSFYLIETDRVKYYDESRVMFGVPVAEAFPSCSADIEEAGRCLAVGRSTACVFHLMRVLSPVIRALAVEFSFKPNENWGPFLNDFRNEIWKKYPDDKSKANEEQRVFYSDLEQQLRAIKDAWRNPTMHCVATVYTEEKAEEIFGYVKGLLKKAAEKLKEKP